MIFKNCIWKENEEGQSRIIVGQKTNKQQSMSSVKKKQVT